MPKKIKLLRICCCILLLALSSLFAAPHIHANDEISLNALIPSNWPPQYSLNDKGEPEGFAIECLDEIAKIANIKINYIVKPNFSEVSKAFKRGEGDLIPNSGIIEQRKDEFVFSSPLEAFQVSIIVRSDSHSISHQRDLLGKRVGVVENNIGYHLLKERKKLRLQVYRDIETALFALLSAQVDAVVFPSSVFMSFAQRVGVSENIKTVGRPLKEILRGIRMRKEDIALMEMLEPAVQTFLKSQSYKDIYKKWYGDNHNHLTYTQIAYLMGGLAFLLVATMSAWRYSTVLRLNKALQLRDAELNDLNTHLEQQVCERTKELENTIAKLVNTERRAKIGSYRYDIESGNWTSSETLDEIFGIDADFEKNTENWLSLVHPEDRLMMSKYLAEHVIAGRRNFDKKYRICRPDNHSTRYLMGFGTLELSNEGVPIVMSGVIQDITKLHKMESEVRQVQKMDALGNLAGGIAHDVNNMLLPVISLSEMVKDDLVRDPKNRRRVEKILEAGNKARDIVAGILAFSHRSDSMDNKQLCFMKDVIEEAMEIISNTIPSSVIVHQTYHCEFVRVICDSAQISTVLMNLASNSADAFKGKNGNWYIELREDHISRARAKQISKRLTPGFYAHIKVVDDAGGMDPHTVEHLFDPFFTTKEVGEGTGLGLAMAHGIVASHKGAITAQSTLGEGTTFDIYLPAQIDEDAL